MAMEQGESLCLQWDNNAQLDRQRVSHCQDTACLHPRKSVNSFVFPSFDYFFFCSTCIGRNVRKQPLDLILSVLTRAFCTGYLILHFEEFNYYYYYLFFILGK